MGWFRRAYSIITAADGLYSVFTNPIISTVVLPAALAAVAAMMAVIRDLPLLEIYVVTIFVAACSAVLIRQILDRWQFTTDRDKLVYQGIRVAVKYDNKGGPIEFALIKIDFVNAAYRRMTIELAEMYVKIGNRVQDDTPRRTQKITLGSHVPGWFSSQKVDLHGLDEDEVNVVIRCRIAYGYEDRRSNHLNVNMAGVGVKEGTEYAFSFWDSEE